MYRCTNPCAAPASCYEPYPSVLPSRCCSPRQLAERLAERVEVFYSFPLLGLAVFRELEAAREGREAPAERLTSATVEELERALADTQLDEFFATLGQPQFNQAVESVEEEVARWTEVLDAVGGVVCCLARVGRLRSGLCRDRN